MKRSLIALLIACAIFISGCGGPGKPEWLNLDHAQPDNRALLYADLLGRNRPLIQNFMSKKYALDVVGKVAARQYLLIYHNQEIKTQTDEPEWVVLIGQSSDRFYSSPIESASYTRCNTWRIKCEAGDIRVNSASTSAECRQEGDSFIVKVRDQERYIPLEVLCVASQCQKLIEPDQQHPE